LLAAQESASPEVAVRSWCQAAWLAVWSAGIATKHVLQIVVSIRAWRRVGSALDSVMAFLLLGFGLEHEVEDRGRYSQDRHPDNGEHCEDREALDCVAGRF